MNLEEFHELLKSRTFKSSSPSGDSFNFNFTEVHIFRDNKHVSDYELSEADGGFQIKFVNLSPPIWVNDFKNVLIVSDNIREIINPDQSTFSGQYDIVLTGQ